MASKKRNKPNRWAEFDQPGGDTPGDVIVPPSAVLEPRPILALGIDQGLLAIVTTSADAEDVLTLARMEDDPLPRIVPTPRTGQGGYFLSQTVDVPGQGPVKVHVAWIPYPDALSSGPLNLALVSESGKKPVFQVNCLPYRSLPADTLADILTRFSGFIAPATQAVLSLQHPVNRALQIIRKGQSPLEFLSTRLLGSLDEIIEGQVHGWAYNPAQAGQALNIEIYEAQEIVGRGLADRFREDLLANKMGDGYHHFRITLSSELFDGKPHTLIAREQATGMDLPGGIKTFTLAAAHQPTHIDCMNRAQTLGAFSSLIDNPGFGQVQRSEGDKAVILRAVTQVSLLQETGLYEEARDGWKKLAGLLGENAVCHCKTGETWLLERQLDKGMQAYRRAIALSPGYFWGHLGLGNAHALLKQPLEAEEAYESALRLAPASVVGVVRRRHESNHAVAAMLRVDGMIQAGQTDAAIQFLRKLVAQQPENQEACTRLAGLMGHDTETQNPAIRAHQTAMLLLDLVLERAEAALAGPSAG